MKDGFREFDKRYLQCRKCGELVHNTEARDEVPDYGETPDSHKCRDFDETGGVPARGF